MAFKAILLALLALCANYVVGLDLLDSHWIWSNDTLSVPPGTTRDFRRTYISPPGKTPSTAEIIISAENSYALFVNGDFIGLADDYTAAHKFCVTLAPCSNNTFAVGVRKEGNAPGSAAFIAAIQIEYDDGTWDTLVTDASWLVHEDVTGFQATNFNDSTWPYAVVLCDYNRVPPEPPSPLPLTFDYAYWIWTNEVPPLTPSATAPTGLRAFRKKIEIPGGKLVKSGTLIIDVDNAYDLYINGKLIGSGVDYHAGVAKVANRWKFTLDQATDDIVIALRGNNYEGPASIIFAIQFDGVDCVFASDGTWRFSIPVPAGFEQPGFDDSKWLPVVFEGPYAPGTLTIQDKP